MFECVYRAHRFNLLKLSYRAVVTTHQTCSLNIGVPIEINRKIYYFIYDILTRHIILITIGLKASS